jgi:hypothetical protein
MRGPLLATTAALALAGIGATAPSPVIGESFLDALPSQQPNAALAAKLALYGRFVGSWEVDIDFYPPNAPPKRARGEWHFSWVLDGRAVQDVFIFPARSARVGKPEEPWWFYGSTFRWFDPAIDAWHVTYFEPTRPFALRQIGRAVDRDIVQTGEEVDGVTRRWRFVEITPASFRWIGEASTDKGVTWTLEMEMRARRAS